MNLSVILCTQLKFVDMRYNEPKNYSKKEPIDMDGNKVLVFNMDTERIRFIDKTESISSGDTIVYTNERINNIIENKIFVIVK